MVRGLRGARERKTETGRHKREGKMQKTTVKTTIITTATGTTITTVPSSNELTLS